MPDLAGRDQAFDRAGHILNRHMRIDPALAEPVNNLDPKPIERRFRNAFDAIRTAAQP